MESEHLYQRLERWLAKGIEQQRWALGDRLPSIRTLCQEQQLSRATVQHALQRLEAQGLVESRPKVGYFVALPPKSEPQPTGRGLISAPRLVTVSDVLQDIMRRSGAFDLLPGSHTGELSPGIMSLNRAIGRSLRRQRREDYHYYDEPAGDLYLREQLALHNARRGWHPVLDQLCITSGCQHALFLALLACCDKGDVVAVESPGFYGVLQLLEQLGLRVVEVPTSIVTGMDVDSLEEVLKRWKIRACVLSPSFATPGGALMPDETKQRILALADQYDLAIIEDDIYADTAHGATPDPLKALDTQNRVILCSSFSKSLSRDIRLGWISGARWHARILQLKLVTQLATSRYLQRGVAEFMSDGGFAAHLRRQRSLLRERRDGLRSALRKWPGEVRVSCPNGGLTVWVELAASVDAMAAYTRALKKGIVIAPGPLFSVTGQFKNCLRISYEHPWNEARLNALKSLPAILYPQA
ncbi:MAG: PLP-dependent aminotransferase family protein [Haliea sp.]|uniref:aminotransferase-like domain-containing protein n=1 Tax=Haliea sp. TaxID=1932666 RepID=UPI0032EE913E